MKKPIVVSIAAPQEGINELSSINILKETEAQTLENVDLDSKVGTISSRDLAEYLSDAGALPSGLEVLAIHFYEKSDGTYYLLATDGVNVYASLSGITAWGTAINNGKAFTAAKPIPWFLNVEGKVWITNGYDSVYQWDGTTYRALNGATASGSGTVTSTGTSIAGTSTAFTTELTVGGFMISGGTTVMVVSIASDTACVVDADPSWSGASFTYQNVPNVPKAELLAFDKSKVIAIKISGSPLSVRMSIATRGGIFLNTDSAAAWPATEELIAPAAYGAALTGIGLVKGLLTNEGIAQGRIILFKDSSMYTLLGTTIADFRFDLLSASVGTRYPRSVEHLEEGSVAFAGELGLYRTDGIDVKRFSDKVENSYNLLSRRQVTVGSTTFSKNFTSWSHTDTEVGVGGLHLSGSNLSGNSESPATQIISTTVLDFLACLIQTFEDSTDTITVEMKTAATSGGLAAAAYAAITDGEIPGNTINKWIQVKISFVRGATTTDPICSVVQINYQSYEVLKREPFMVYDSDELLFGFDQDYKNLRLSLNRNGAWTIDTEVDVDISCGTRFQGVKYLGASNGRVYSLYSEASADTLAIASTWQTKPITCGYPDRLKSLDYIVVFSEGSAFKRCIIDFIVDGIRRYTQEFVNSGTNLRELKLWMQQGLLFKTLELVLRTTVDQQISLIGRIDLHTRLLESEEAN